MRLALHEAGVHQSVGYGHGVVGRVCVGGEYPDYNFPRLQRWEALKSILPGTDLPPVE